MVPQLHHGVVITRFQRQITVLRIAFEQPPTLQKPRNPVTDGMHEGIELHFEPLIEMMQVKGNSEVHRKLWPADEFADFENADSIQNSSGRTFNKIDFVREGLKQGLAVEQSLGTNPFKYGVIGGTDNHNGLPSAVAEDSFIGAHGAEDGTIERRRNNGVAGWIDGKDLSIGSLAAVWATENTRGAIWDGMKRRETFSTSGPRIMLRFFGGEELDDPVDAVSLVEQGYTLGVPKGGDLGSIGVHCTRSQRPRRRKPGSYTDHQRPGG